MVAMGAILDEQARRLFLARWLTWRVEEQAGGVVASDAILGFIDALEHRVDELSNGRPVLPGLCFSPRYPGDVIEATTVAGMPRVVLACRACIGLAPLGVVFTVLVGERRPQVAVGPPNAWADTSSSAGAGGASSGQDSVMSPSPPPPPRADR